MTPATTSALRIDHTDRDRHPVAVYLARQAPGPSAASLRSSCEVLARLISGGTHTAESLPWHELRFQHTAAIRAKLASSGYAHATCNKHLSALRGILRAAWRLGLVAGEDYHAAVDDLRHFDTVGPPAGRALEPHELAALRCELEGDHTDRGRRDRALVELLVDAGLRRAEAVRLDRPTELEVLRVVGKRHRIRDVPLTRRAADALRAWLAVAAPARPLFRSFTAHGVLTDRRLSVRAVANIVAARAAAAGIGPLAPHDLRRTFGTTLLARGADVLIVQSLMGHSDPRTTKRYDRRAEGAMRAAVRLLEV